MAAYLNSLIGIRSQRAERYLRYLQALRDGPLPVRLGPDPSYLGGRRLRDLLLEPDVLRRERQLVPGADRHREQRPSSNLLNTFSSAALDVSEPSSRDLTNAGRERTVERRVSWLNELLGLRPGQWTAILGAPGQGKSVLVEMSVRRLASRVFTTVEEQTQSVDQVTLPVVTTASALTKGGTPGHESSEDALRKALKRVLTRDGVDGSMRDEIAERAHESCITLFIDGLDQIGGESRWLTFDQFLQVLSRWKTRDIFTSRPYGWRPRDRPVTVTEYRLAPLNDVQIRQFVDTWSQTCSFVTSVHDLVLRSRAVNRLASVPLLLTLICWAAERYVINRDVTRTEVYDLVVHDLLALDPGTHHLDATRATDWLAYLPQVALLLFHDTDGGRRSIFDADLTATIAQARRDRPRPSNVGLNNRDKARSLLNELAAKGVLVPTTAERAIYEFTDRSVWEY